MAGREGRMTDECSENVPDKVKRLLVHDQTLKSRIRLILFTKWVQLREACDD